MAIAITPLLQLAPDLLGRWLERRRIKSELASLDVLDNHFERKLQAALAGQGWAAKRRMNLETRLRDIENDKR